MDLHILDGQTARATTATAINTGIIAQNTAVTAQNTALLVESNEKIARSNHQIMMHLLDTKCLQEYGMTSAEIEKEYYKYTDAIVSIIHKIEQKRIDLFKANYRKAINHHRLTLKDKIYGFFSPSYKENAEREIFFLKQQDKELIDKLKSELSDLSVDIQQINELMPIYNDWRTKISRMNIPTFRRYRKYRKLYFDGKDLSHTTKQILYDNDYTEFFILSEY